MLQLTAEGCAARRERLIKSVEADFLMITNPRHIQYLSGLYITSLALSAWGLNFLTIDSRSGKTRLYVHNFLDADAQSSHVDELEVWTWYDYVSPGVELFGRAIDDMNARLRSVTGRIGVEIGWFPLGVNVTNPVNITPTLLEMQRSKYPDELALIREAVRVTEAGHQAAREIMRPGITELDVYNAVQTGMVTEAGSGVLLMGDLVSGERAYQVGGVATNRVLQAGELMIIDVFPVVNGYRADFTVTLSVDGHLTDQQKALETALHEAMTAGEAMLRPGVVAGDVYRAVRAALDKRGFGAGFSHHAGHGLGLGHPQSPFFVPESRETVVAGDVVTIEPGSYGADFGARIENNYLITETGSERLSHHNTAFS
jgi:Xaa-Pro aminopeptidase